MKALGKSATSTSQAPPSPLSPPSTFSPHSPRFKPVGKIPILFCPVHSIAFLSGGVEVGWHLLVLSTQDERPWYWALLLGDRA